MKLRIIIQSNNTTNAVHAQGAVHQTYKTFSIDAAEVVSFLTKKEPYTYHNVVGVEIVRADPNPLEGDTK